LVEGGPYWIEYCWCGKVFRESTKSSSERDARKLLKTTMEEIKRPIFIGPSEHKLGIGDLETKVLADYRKHNRKSHKTVEFCFKPLKASLRLTELSTEGQRGTEIRGRTSGRWRRTIHCKPRIGISTKGFKLLLADGEISTVPAIRLLEGENVRSGFIQKPEFDKLLAHLSCADAQDIVEFLYNSAGDPVRRKHWRTQTRGKMFTTRTCDPLSHGVKSQSSCTGINTSAYSGRLVAPE
jgi:hypothetical protein